MTVRHLLAIDDDLSPSELNEVLGRAAEPPPAVPPLAGRTVGLCFEKPSLRTRHSCEVAVVQLGGPPVTLRRDEVGSGEREPVSDIARVLSGYHAAPDTVFMHCLPAHRGEEVAASGVDGRQSRVTAQAHNRLHSSRGLLSWLIEEAER